MLTKFTFLSRDFFLRYSYVTYLLTYSLTYLLSKKKDDGKNTH